jgi:cation:H+ antiporter
MFQVFFTLICSLVLLYCGAEGLVRGSARLARRLGLTSLVVGLTIVAYGTSAPELLVSSRAALNGQGAIALGNVIGSNIFNIAVILGLSALIRPLKVKLQIIRFDMPVLIAVSVLFLGLFLNFRLGRTEGLILTLGSILYTIVSIHFGKRDADSENIEGFYPGHPERGSIIFDLLMVAGGLVLLILGSKLLVGSAVQLARVWGINDAVVALTIVAGGTSIPELATSIVATVRKETDIAIGNVVGSNIFNILCILGVSSLVAPLNGGGISLVDTFVMIGTGVLLLPFMWTRFTLQRWEGFLLLIVYAGYLYSILLK